MIQESYKYNAIGIGTGNPGVFQGYPYLYPSKQVQVLMGMGVGFPKAPWVCNLCTGTPPNPTKKPCNSSAGVN
jgi:hypothetical protein